MLRNSYIALLLLSVSCGGMASAGANSDSQGSPLLHSVYVRKYDDISKVLAGENTRYIIRYNHDLSRYKDGVVIGANSVLAFRRGSLNNGIIIFNKTRIEAERKKVFSNNEYKGQLDVAETYPEWFGAVGDGKTDDTRFIQEAMDVSGYILGERERVYAVRTDSPYKHCLTVNKDSLAMSIDLKDLNEYTSSDYRGGGVIFVDNKMAFSFNGSITSVNGKLPVSAKTGVTLEGSRAGIVCYGDCGWMSINLTCSNLYCGILHGAYMYDEYLYRNGTVGIHHSNIEVNAYRVAYPVALNYANNCEIVVHGDHMHRCVYLCGEYNEVNAQGRNYHATAAPAHILLLSNVLKYNDQYKIVTCNHNIITYTQLEGEKDNLQDGAIFQFQNIRLDLNSDVPHTDYSFIDNTVNLYCCELESKNIQLLYKSFASNWVYDKEVSIECVFNIYGNISSYLSYASFEFFANTKDRITVNNYTKQQLVYTFSYSGNQKSVYQINGDSKSRTIGTSKYPFHGTLKLKGGRVYLDTTLGNPRIIGNIYVEGGNAQIIQDKRAHARHIHIVNEK